MTLEIKTRRVQMYFINLKSYKIDLWLLLLRYYNIWMQLQTGLFTSTKQMNVYIVHRIVFGLGARTTESALIIIYFTLFGLNKSCRVTKQTHQRHSCLSQSRPAFQKLLFNIPFSQMFLLDPNTENQFSLGPEIKETFFYLYRRLT